MESTKNPDEPLWTVEFTFHGAKSVPVADFPGFTADPFLACELAVPAHPHHGDDNPLLYRSPTVRACLNPSWESTWRVGGIPGSGFKLTIRLRDEDPGDHDDRLGSLTIRESDLREGLVRDHVEYDVKKRRGSVRAYLLTYLASAVTKTISTHARLYLSIRVLGRTPNQGDRRVYTVGPHWWSVHYSPMIGRIAGTRGPNVRDEDDPSKPGKTVRTFQANKLQLGGPVPAELKHHFVGYRPFIEFLFTQKGLRGRILHFGLRRQYGMIYYYSRSTEYGVIECERDNLGGGEDAKGKSVHEADQPQTNDIHRSSSTSSSSPKSPNESSEPEESHTTALARRFLEMTHWGAAGRLYTYIITLDGEWHFTETGPEFAIDMLSKHSMHSNVAPDIAYSGEFFVQEYNADSEESDNAEHADGSGGVKGGGGGDPASASEDKGKQGEGESEEEKKKAENTLRPPPASSSSAAGPSSGAKSEEMTTRPSTSSRLSKSTTGRPKDPKRYELVIDNDSGTYRPKKEYLPIFEKWLSSAECLGGLGRVRAMDGFDEKLKGMKERRAKIKADIKKRRGEPIDQDDPSKNHVLKAAGSSISKKEAKKLGRSGSVSSSDVESLVEEARTKEKEAEAAEREHGPGDEAAKKKETEAREVEGKAEAAQDAP